MHCMGKLKLSTMSYQAKDTQTARREQDSNLGSSWWGLWPSKDRLPMGQQECRVRQGWPPTLPNFLLQREATVS
jgi:hypothetical protein